MDELHRVLLVPPEYQSQVQIVQRMSHPNVLDLDGFRLHTYTEISAVREDMTTRSLSLGNRWLMNFRAIHQASGWARCQRRMRRSYMATGKHYNRIT